MRFVDSQVHIWGANTPARPWPARAHAQRDTPVTGEEVLGWMDEAGVDRAILVPPSWEGDRNDLALAVARDHPDRFAVMGRLDPDAPGARDQLARWRAQPGMLGLRFTFHTPVLRQPLLDGRFDWVWGEAERHGVPVMLLIHHSHMHLIDAVAAQHPALKLVIDHLGLVNGEKDAHAFRELHKLLALSSRPNIAVKASALPCYTDEPYPHDVMHAHIRRVYDAFGPRRMFWGTDQTRSPIDYRRGIELFTRHLPWLTPDDLEWIMGRGVCAWIGWNHHNREGDS
ncbi:MAG TPA: amidohydrolase family protein [Usitatibacter sp.]|jgi:predicted TIM-barrel fold metal-dependent hydrolase|nr:amidohydrolase family protein [Usitatibacter sp.]